MNPLPGNVMTNAMRSSPMLDVLGVGNLDQASTSRNIEAVGTEFESVFLSMMIKEMRQSLDGGFFGDEGSDTYGGMFDLFIGKDLAQTRPLGIADMLLKQYEQQNPPASDDPSPATGTTKTPTSFTA